MIRSLLFLFLAMLSMQATGQGDSALKRKPLHVWITNSTGTVERGVLVGFRDSAIVMYPGKLKEWWRHINYPLKVVEYSSIQKLSIRRPDGVFRGMAIGAGIGLLPIVAGQGGAFVAIITAPLGVLTGTVVGAIAKKNYTIDQSYNNFLKLKKKLKKER